MDHVREQQAAQRGNHPVIDIIHVDDPVKVQLRHDIPGNKHREEKKYRDAQLAVVEGRAGKEKKKREPEQKRHVNFPDPVFCRVIRQLHHEEMKGYKSKPHEREPGEDFVEKRSCVIRLRRSVRHCSKCKKRKNNHGGTEEARSLNISVGAQNFAYLQK